MASKEKPHPMALLEHINNTFGSSLWDKIEKCRNNKSTWDERCYIPITHVCNIIEEYGNKIIPQTIAGTIAALAGWRRSKEIYRFDPDFTELLTSGADEDLPIPYEALRMLPYTSLYIDAQIGNVKGFFVYYEHDIKTDVMELRLDAITKDDPDFASAISLHLVGETIGDGIQDNIRTARKSSADMERYLGKSKAAIVWREYESLVKDFTPKAMQLVLYLCAANAEIAANIEQRTITKRTPQIKDKYREIRKWDVGTDAGVRIRQFKSSRSEGTQRKATGSHASPVPHMRRAHWHHFWIGKHDSDDRKLILKWVAPTFVAGTGEEVTEATIIKMK